MRPVWLSFGIVNVLALLVTALSWWGAGAFFAGGESLYHRSLVSIRFLNNAHLHFVKADAALVRLAAEREGGQEELDRIETHWLIMHDSVEIAAERAVSDETRQAAEDMQAYLIQWRAIQDEIAANRAVYAGILAMNAAIEDFLREMLEAETQAARAQWQSLESRRIQMVIFYILIFLIANLYVLAMRLGRMKKR